MSRIIAWMSCGAPSMVAAKLALVDNPDTIVAYCEIVDEHDDHKRIIADFEKWAGKKVLILGNDKYNRSVEEVVLKTGFLVGPKGAKCTGELKKRVREEFQRPTDRHILGYTVEEQGRYDDFIDANNDLDVWPILIERGLTKADCKAIVVDAGIELSTMYKLGYKNDNCLGCLKGSPGYFNKIRVDFPPVFESRARLEEITGNTICKIGLPTVKRNYPDIYKKLGEPELLNERGNPNYWRPTLRELPLDAGDYPNDLEVECGIFCHMAKQDIAKESTCLKQ